jgi:TolB-like protein/class 3 adenylate cyclase/Flp pilus assembly protein TadD
VEAAGSYCLTNKPKYRAIKPLQRRVNRGRARVRSMSEQRRLAAVVMVDVVGFSRLVGRDEPGTLAALKKLRRELIDPAIAAHGGRIVKTTGDGLLLEFPSVVGAVKCTVRVQNAMAERAAAVAEEDRIVFRTGISLGDIIIDGDDIFGDGVNMAARLESIAPPGGIAVSHNVIANIGSNVPAAFVDIGEQRLKNIDRPVRTYHWTPPHDGRPTVRASAIRRRLISPVWAGMAFVLLVASAIGLWFHGPALLSVISAGSPTTRTPVAAREAAPSRVDVAVLPFINQSGDASQEYFSDGLTEDVISALARFRSLTVLSRNAVFPYKGSTLKSAELGRELGVPYLVEASVRRASERIRVNAQLTESASGKLLWSHQFDADLGDVFAVQDAIARNIVGALEVNLTRAEQQRALAKPTENLNAYDLVLRGRERLWLGTRGGNREARRLFEQASALDPRYASAHAWLARAYLDLADQGWAEDPSEATERALDEGKKALALNPDDVEALSVLGVAHVTRSEYDLALAAADRLLTINPSDANGLISRQGVLLWSGRIDEAVAAGEEAARYNPQPSPPAIFGFGLAYYQAKRHADAARVIERGVVRFPNTAYLYPVLAAAYAQMGRMPEAAQALQTLQRLNPFFDAETFGSRFRDPKHQAYLREGIAKAGWH